MELTQEQKLQLAEVEMCLDRYFDSQVKPLMVGAQREMSRRQMQERAEFDSSLAGVMMTITAGNAYAKDAYLHAAGEWNSKTTEDFFSMCRKEVQQNQNMQKDLNILSDVWRTRMVGLIGREAYDTHSQRLGQDLAKAYIAYRIEDRMIGHMVDQRVPKSSVEYVLRKGMDSSLVGFLSTAAVKTELDEVLEGKAEKAYSPNVVENLTGHALGLGVDVLSTGGVGSWAKLGWTVGAETMMQGSEWIYGKYLDASMPRSVEDIVSRAVLESDGNTMADIQREGSSINHDENALAHALDEQMEGRMMIMTSEDKAQIYRFGMPDENPWRLTHIESDLKPYDAKAPLLPEEHVPLNLDKAMQDMEYPPVEQERHDPDLSNVVPLETEQVTEHREQQSQQTDGWGSMLTTIGLNDMGGVGRNLGYVVAMLPDLVVGLFTGKTDGLKLMKDNMLPLASVLMGLFVRNPLLRIALIGLGGMNLLNKAGHEAIDRKHVADGVTPPEGRTPRFRHYEDQPLNSRMRSPEIHEGALFATVDGVPCSIRLPEKVLAAYAAGALPLNTLANAVLAKSDTMSQVARDNYDASQEEVTHRNLHV